MKNAIIMVVVLYIASFAAEQKSINLDIYKNKAGFTWAETTVVIGKHTYHLVNIKNTKSGDTACISAIILDKRKFVFTDLVSTGTPYGLTVPKKQPLTNGLIVFKGSPVESKTFIFLATGKLITLPGSLCIVDNEGSTVYCVWNNDEQYRLTLLDMNALRVLLTAVPIPKPLQWYSNGIQFGFTTTEDTSTYIVDLLAKEVRKGEPFGKDATPLNYIPGFDKTNMPNCCSGKMWSK